MLSMKIPVKASAGIMIPLGRICARLNCVPEYIETSWEGLIVAISNGEYDMAADGITITEERAQIVDYSEGYIDVIQRMMGARLAKIDTAMLRNLLPVTSS